MKSTLFTATVVVVIFTMFTVNILSREVDPIINSAIIGGTQSFNNPSGISLRHDGRGILVANTLQQTITYIDNDGSVVNDYAGIKNRAGFNGDGLLARETTFSNPYGIYLNGESLFIADTWNQKIRHVNISTNIVSTIAGSELICGFSGDGNLAIHSQLCNPQSIHFSKNGKLYIADTHNDRIRMINNDGIISTICGTTSSGFGGDGGNATLALLDKPKFVFVTTSSSFNNQQDDIIYIADTNNNRVRKIENSIITTIAGGDEPGFNGDGIDARDALLCNPSCIYVRPHQGDIFICDSCNNRVRRILSNGTIYSLPFEFEFPTGIYMDDNTHNIYISESSKGIIRNISYSCPKGYYLKDDDLMCHPICSCSINGKCVEPGICQCDEGYGGEYCQYHICYGKVGNNTCSLHGTCINYNNCSCEMNYFGMECSITTCFNMTSINENVCNSHGQCTLYNNCNCNMYYGGEECQYPICFGFNSSNINVCSSHGQCIEPSKCRCEDGYTGSNCEFPICYGLTSNDTTIVCNGNGKCINPNECQCFDGYSGLICQFPSCYGYNSTDQPVCSQHGECIKRDECTCLKDQYTGNLCEIPICENRNGSDPLVCSGNGQCIEPSKCQCKDGYIGSNCEFPICYGLTSNDTTSRVCTGHGQCISPNQCKCLSNFTGYQCEIAICNGRNETDLDVCSGNGQCRVTSFNTTTYCDCKRYWNGQYVGNDCQYPTCLSIPSFEKDKVCGGRGECIAPNTCSCYDKKYDGIYCEFPTCYGKSSRDNTACNGFTHGSCESPDNCICKSGNYTGIQCEIPICYGLKSSNRNVCSKRGICKDSNQCQCNNGYTGEQCEIPLCFTIQANDKRVCSNGNGTCIEKNQCKCNEGYQGDQCEIPICGGLPSTDLLHSCGGSIRGVCLAHNSCSCISGQYYGSQCEHANCFGIGSTERSVCSGFGKCTSYDYCQCDPGRDGYNCFTTTSTIFGLSTGLVIFAIAFIITSIIVIYYCRYKRRKINIRVINNNNIETELQICLLNESEKEDIDINIPMQLDPTDSLDNNLIKLKKEIANGGQGKVWMGEFNSQIVAIKTVEILNVSSENSVIPIDIASEINNLKNIEHDNIVKFYGYSFIAKSRKGLFNRQTCNLNVSIVMEYIENSLAGIIKSAEDSIQSYERNNLTIFKTIEILLKISKGLNYIHSMNPPIIHMDLKPDNILISKDFKKVKICDFGLSIKTKKALTVNKGTIEYMSPEIILANNNYEHDDGYQGDDDYSTLPEILTHNSKVDIYSFGIIMWEIFFLKKPYSDHSIYTTITDKFLISQKRDKDRFDKHKNTLSNASTQQENFMQAVRYGNYRPFIPFGSDDLDEWIQQNKGIHISKPIVIKYISLMKKCWNKNPEKRPSASHLEIELQGLLDMVKEEEEVELIEMIEQ